MAPTKSSQGRNILIFFERASQALSERRIIDQLARNLTIVASYGVFAYFNGSKLRILIIVQVTLLTLMASSAFLMQLQLVLDTGQYSIRSV